MNGDDELVSEVWVSGTYNSVFFSRQEVENFLDSLLNPDGSPPDRLNVVFVPRRLVEPKTKREIKTATSDQLRKMLGMTD